MKLSGMTLGLIASLTMSGCLPSGYITTPAQLEAAEVIPPLTAGPPGPLVAGHAASGDILLRQTLMAAQSARLTDPLHQRINDTYGGAHTIALDQVLYRVDGGPDAASLFCSSSNTLSAGSLFGSTGYPSCLVDIDHDGSFDKIYALVAGPLGFGAPNAGIVTGETILAPKVRYVLSSKSDAPHVEAGIRFSKGAFNRGLLEPVLFGVDGKPVAYLPQVKIPGAENLPARVEIFDVVIEITGVSDAGLDYRVLSGLKQGQVYRLRMLPAGR